MNQFELPCPIIDNIYINTHTHTHTYTYAYTHHRSQITDVGASSICSTPGKRMGPFKKLTGRVPPFFPIARAASPDLDLNRTLCCWPSMVFGRFEHRWEPGGQPTHSTIPDPAGVRITDCNSGEATPGLDEEGGTQTSRYATYSCNVRDSRSVCVKYGN